MSTRSSPLSSPSPPPPQNQITDPFRSLSPLSSVSDISQSGGLPPSSPPLGDTNVDIEADEEIGEEGRDTRSQTSETVPLGSESDLTEEEEDEVEDEEGVVLVDGPPVGIRPSVVPESLAEDNGDLEMDDEPTPHHTRPKRIVSATTSASPTRTRSTSGQITRQASKSPSLTPPPPSEKTRLRALPRLSASPGVKRKRSSPPESPVMVPEAQLPVETGSTGDDPEERPAKNGDHLELNEQEVGSPDGVKAESYEDKDITVDDPEADQAFKEAMDSFDNELEPDVVNEEPAEEVVDGDEEMRVNRDEDAQEEPSNMDAEEDGAVLAVELGQDEDVGESADQAGEGAEPTEAEESGAVDESDTAPQAAITEESTSTEQEEPAPSPKATLHPPAPHSHSSHAPPPTQAAMRALLALEVKFAALRDRLYIERMEEAAEEEEMILNGSHPALKQLHKTLSHRRERLHELASRRHAQAVQQLKVVRQAEQDAVWSWWTDERDRTHWEEFEQTWSKRRRLAREKNEIESVRWTKPVPIAGDPRFGKSFDWAAGPSPARLTLDEGNHDLAVIEHRQQISRHASPAVFPPLSSYPIPQHPGQYPSYPPPGSHNQTYAEAVSEPRPRQSSSSHYHSRQPQPQQPPPYTGTGLMDHYAYPRNATAIGPTTSSSSLGLSQPSSQPRREGRTVPTASTMFGPGPGSGSTPNHASSMANAQFPTLTSAVPNAQNGIAKEMKQESLDYLNRDKTSTHATATAPPAPTGYGNIGPWGNRSVPMGFGLGFGLGGGGSGSSTAGFGTLGSTQTQGNAAVAGRVGQGRKEGSNVNGSGMSNGYQPPWAPQAPSSPGKYGQADRPAEITSTTSTPAQTPTPTPTSGRPPTPLQAQAQAQRPNPNPTPNSTNQFSRVSANSSGNGSGGITTLNGVLADKEKEREREKEKEKEREKERERERSRPKYPGLAEYLDATAALAAAAADGHGRGTLGSGALGAGAVQGGQAGAVGVCVGGGGGAGGAGLLGGAGPVQGYGGLGRLGIMGSNTNGVLSPPRISRSPFGPPPPQATTTSAPAQTASRT